MTKEEFIRGMIQVRKKGEENPSAMYCHEFDWCKGCAYEESDGDCDEAIINDLIDHIIGLEESIVDIVDVLQEEQKETNLEHYWDNLYVYFSAHRNDGYLAFVDSNMKDMAKWLLAPYEEPKPKYKLTRFEWDLLKATNYEHCVIENDTTLKGMKAKGYFKYVPKDVGIKEVLENAEVIDSEID